MSDARYDRQLRIWGGHGQRRLQEARVCVINGGPCGSETLKNLVLGGIGGFVLIDDDVVKDEDFGKNYLIDLEGLGQSRGETVCRLVAELNPVVKGTTTTSPEESIEETDYFKGFSLVIATQLRTERLKKLVSICQRIGVPLIVVRSYGLMGIMKVYFKEACVVESKPDDEVPDLRLGMPWAELTTFVSSIELDALDDVQHSHVPYAVILLKAGELWKKSNAASLPTTADDKRQYKVRIDQLRRTKKAAGIEEENFEEAMRSAYQYWTPYSIPSTVKEILEDDCMKLRSDAADFWIVVAAIEAFLSKHGVLPLNGQIPDMTATTEFSIIPHNPRHPCCRFYLKLQEIYRHKAQSDVAEVEATVKLLLERLERPIESISHDDVTLIGKNARHLRLVRSQPVPLSQDPSLFHRLRNPDTFRNVAYAALVEAADVFYDTHARYPGAFHGDDDWQWEEDGRLLMTTLQSIVDLRSLERELHSELHTMANEVCRFGGGELHNVSAVMGGIAAQEAIKLLTNQFVPFGGTLVYNAMDSTASSL